MDSPKSDDNNHGEQNNDDRHGDSIDNDCSSTSSSNTELVQTSDQFSQFVRIKKKNSTILMPKADFK